VKGCGTIRLSELARMFGAAWLRKQIKGEMPSEVVDMHENAK
jgi:hypothetical protein